MSRPAELLLVLLVPSAHAEEGANVRLRLPGDFSDYCNNSDNGPNLFDPMLACRLHGIGSTFGPFMVLPLKLKLPMWIIIERLPSEAPPGGSTPPLATRQSTIHLRNLGPI